MKRKEVEEIRKLNPYRGKIKPSKIAYPLVNSHNSVGPLTDFDRWVMACILNVPLEIVERTEKNFWEYVKNPTNLKKYKTSYLTIKKWISLDLQRGNIQNCSDTERMKLATQEPDMMKLIQETFDKKD